MEYDTLKSQQDQTGSFLEKVGLGWVWRDKGLIVWYEFGAPGDQSITQGSFRPASCKSPFCSVP